MRRRESSRQLVTQPSLRAERPAPAGERRFGAPCGPPEQSGQPRAHAAQRASWSPSPVEGTASCARESEALWRPLRAAGAERAAPCSHSPEGQLVTQPSLRAERPAPAGQRGLWRPLRAAGAERAAPHSHSPEGSPRSSSAASAQTGSPNPNGTEQLHDPPQDTVRDSQSLHGMRPQKGSHLRHF